MTDDQRRRARLDWADANRTVADYARALVPTTTDRVAAPGEYIRAARRLRLAAERALDAAIVLEHHSGTPTDAIADELRLPAAEVQRRLTRATPGSATAADLDRWYATTGPGAPLDAVSSCLY